MRNDLRGYEGEPKAVLRLIFRNKIALLAGKAQNGIKRDFALNKGKGALYRISVGFGYPAPINQNDAAIAQGKGVTM